MYGRTDIQHVDYSLHMKTFHDKVHKLDPSQHATIDDDKFHNLDQLPPNSFHLIVLTNLTDANCLQYPKKNEVN